MTPRKRTRKPTSDALEILDRMIGNDRRARRRIKRHHLDTHIAEEIYAARTSARMSQARLARLVGTTPGVISRLDDADHDARSLGMLQRIALALHRGIEVRLVPEVG